MVHDSRHENYGTVPAPTARVSAETGLAERAFTFGQLSELII